MSDVIKNRVDVFVESQEMFTSVNVANAIKQKGTWIRNSEVAKWLRNNFNYKDYQASMINLDNGRSARLYHPDYADPDNYTDKNLKAITPDEFNQMNGNKKVSQSRISTIATSTTSSGNKITIKAKKIRIPAKIVKQLGLNPGDSVDISKFDVIPPRKNRVVNSDGRIIIPRSSLSTISNCNPINVFIENKKVKFEAA